MEKEKIFKKLKKQFLDEDKAEPFGNRSYVSDTIQVFDMLIDGDEDDSLLIQGSALVDVVSDICRYYYNKEQKHRRDLKCVSKK